MKLSNRECAIFLKELGNVLNAGISASEGLDIILDNFDNAKFKDKLVIAKKSLDYGERLSEALKMTECFDDYLIMMIDIGEKTGYLDRSINELAKYYERLDNSANKLKEALYYPMFILLMMVVVMIVIVTKVLPVFEEVLNNMGFGLNTNALILMKIGKWLADYGLIIIILMIVLGILYFLFMQHKYPDDTFKMILLKNPITGKLAKNMNTSIFVFGLSLLVNSGYEENSALEILKELTNDETLNIKIDEMSKELSEGVSLADALCNAHILKNVYERMIKIGYKCGKFENTINEVAMKYEEEVDSSLNKFLNAIEPSIIIICSLIVGIILLSVMLPLLSIMSSI